MIFNKSTKEAFIHPPKNGRHSIHDFLLQLGWKTLPFYHGPLEFYTDRYPNLLNYTVYSFFRNPYERFESAVLNIKRDLDLNAKLEEVVKREKPDSQILDTSYKTILEIFPVIYQEFPGYFYEQAYWLDNTKVTSLDFDNFEQELRRIAKNDVLPIQFINTKNSDQTDKLTQEEMVIVKNIYKKDFDLYLTKFGKSI